MMGRRRIRTEEVGESLLTEALVMRAMIGYSKPVLITKVIRQMLHIEKRLGQDPKPYVTEVKALLDRLVAAGRVEWHKIILDERDYIAVPGYMLGPLERLSLA